MCGHFVAHAVKSMFRCSISSNIAAGFYSLSTSWQVGLTYVAGQIRAAAYRAEAYWNNPLHLRRRQHRRKERRIFQQHADMWRLLRIVGVHAASSRSAAHLPDVVTPASE